jgi:hypothetical protein
MPSSLTSQLLQQRSTSPSPPSWQMWHSLMMLMSEDAPGKTRRTSLAPRLCIERLYRHDFYKFIYPPPPPKVKFFGWLLVQNCIQTKENLLNKHCLHDDTCEICNEAVESVAHLIAGCPFSGFWHRIGANMVEDNVASLWDVRPPTHIPGAHFSIFLLLRCWRLWKHRYDIAFHSLPPCYNRLFAGCRKDADLWACRLPRADRRVALAWAEVFSLSTYDVPSITDM